MTNLKQIKFGTSKFPIARWLDLDRLRPTQRKLFLCYRNVLPPDGNELFSTPSTLYELERLILLQLSKCLHRGPKMPPEHLSILISINFCRIIVVVSNTDDNEISIIPSEIGRMTGLEWLDLGKSIGCIILALILQCHTPNSVIQHFLHYHEPSIPSLAQNQMTSIPSEIGLLANLSYLDISKCFRFFCGNDMLECDPFLFANRMRHVLVTGGNNIQVLPSEIGLLTALTKLLIRKSNT